jgi:hypothetical protein
MANYYVSAARGSNSNNGTSPNTPWLTIAKAIAGTPAITLSGGDTLYIEPGIYREQITLALSPTVTNTLTIVGDVDGAGFLAGGYSTPATGLVTWSGFNNGDTTASSNDVGCLTASSKNYVTLRKIHFVGGSKVSTGSCVNLATSYNWTIEDCFFVGHSANNCTCIEMTNTAGVTFNNVVRRCHLWQLGTQSAIRVTAPSHSGEYASGIVIENNFIVSLGNAGIGLIGTVGSFWMSGAVIQYNTIFVRSTSSCVSVNTYVGTLASPHLFYSNILIGNATGYNVAATGLVTEDGTVYVCSTRTANATVGGNSTAALVSPMLELGQSAFMGLPPRPLGEPLSGSYIMGRGNYGTPPSVDALNRTRPEGGGSVLCAAGAMERHDTAVKDTTNYDAGTAGTACAKIVGPGSQDVQIGLAGGSAVTLAVKVRWDGNHGDTNKPRAIILANPEAGVSTQTVTATSTGGSGASLNSYETLSFSSFTPTSDGVITIRLASRAAAGNGVACFDSISST